MEIVKLRLKGESPLLMHSDRSTNPLDPAVKRHKTLTSVRKKADEVNEAIARSEWDLAMYHDDDAGPVMPTANIRAVIVAGGRLNKLGAAIERGAVMAQSAVPVKYEGPRTKDEMWNDGRFTDARSVVVNRGRVMRYRPLFVKWEIEVDVMLDESVIDKEQMLQCAQNGGRLIGLCDNRRNGFGRFSVEVIK